MKELDIPLYTKIGPHWAEFIQDVFKQSGSKVTKEHTLFTSKENSETYFTKDGLEYSLGHLNRCIVGEPWHLTSKWNKCTFCDHFGMDVVFEHKSWKQYAKGLETFAKHYLKEHLGCKL